MHFCRQSPTPPAPSQGYPCPSVGLPHPARACGAPPPPHRGRGPCVAIPGGQSCPALLQGLPMLWTVGISPRGVGPTGRGNEFPLPCLPHSNHLTSRRQATHTLLSAAPTPPAPSLADTRIPRRCLRRDTHALLPAPPPRRRLRQGIPMSFCRHPHPTRACGAPPPPPPGAGSVPGRIPGGQSCPALLQGLPILWTVWISPRGVGPTGRGNSFPLPCFERSRDPTYLPRPTHAFGGRLPLHSCRPPHPARASDDRCPRSP